MIRVLKIFLLLGLLAVLAWFILPKKTAKEIVIKKNPIIEDNLKTETPANIALPEQTDNEVAFTSQSPLIQWSDPEQNAGCEEASLLMASLWLSGTDSISPEEADKKLKDIFKFERDNYGNSIDASAADTEKLFKDYFNQDAHLETNVSTETIITALAEGKLIIIPADGRKLNNPHFRQPGPERHMLLIRGYDTKKEEFITNDPGTKAGEAYRYNFQTLINAIRDYPSGNHVPIETEKKVMLIIEK